MKLVPSSPARLRTWIAVVRSAGSPQIPGPVIRIAPKPNRLTRRGVDVSAAIVKVLGLVFMAIPNPGAVSTLDPGTFRLTKDRRLSALFLKCWLKVPQDGQPAQVNEVRKVTLWVAPHVSCA